MPPFLVFVVIGLALIVAGVLAVRASGAEPRIARRLAGAREYRVGDLVGTPSQHDRPVRVVGRIRCPDPIRTERDERLVALHRDVQVKPPGSGWRTIERIREARGFELWDHDGSLPLDPALAAEPLIVIPHVWRGTTAELTQEIHQAAVARLGGEGAVAWPARSVTRIVSVVERLLVLASVQRSNGGVVLVPPQGGFVLSGLALDDAMRLLGGNRRGLLLAGYGMAVAGGLLAVVGAIGSILG